MNYSTMQVELQICTEDIVIEFNNVEMSALGSRQIGINEWMTGAASVASA